MKNKMSNSTPEETNTNEDKQEQNTNEIDSGNTNTQQQNAQNIVIAPNQMYQSVAPQYAGYIQIQNPVNETIDVGANTTLSITAAPANLGK